MAALSYGMLLSPAYTYPDQVPTQLRQQGYAVLSPQGVCELAGCTPGEYLGRSLPDGGGVAEQIHSDMR